MATRVPARKSAAKKAPAKRAAARTTAAKKAPAKKAAAKKPTAKKTTAKKTTARKTTAEKSPTTTSGSRPKTIAAYIASAPAAGRPLLKRLHAILAEAAPEARQVMKWNAPFFVEPRFVYSYNYAKHHANLAATAGALRHFRDELAGLRTTKYFLQLPYDEPLPEDLIRRIAAWRVAQVAARGDDGFWGPP